MFDTKHKDGCEFDFLYESCYNDGGDGIVVTDTYIRLDKRYSSETIIFNFCPVCGVKL